MTVADGIVLAVFVLLLPLMAARVGRSLQREEEYFTGGQRTNLFQLVFFMFGSGTATDSTSVSGGPGLRASGGSWSGSW
jgi:Na+/proline symporter